MVVTDPATTARSDARHRLGRLGEVAATLHLRRLGWRILARNVRLGGVEVDIVALEPEPVPTVVVVEVRSRSGVVFGDARESVDRGKVRRLYRAAFALGDLDHDLRRTAGSARVDLVAVLRRGTGRWAVTAHLRGIEPP